MDMMKKIMAAASRPEAQLKMDSIRAKAMPEIRVSEFASYNSFFSPLAK